MRFAPVFKYRMRDCMTSMAVVIVIMIALTVLCYFGIVTFGQISTSDGSGEVIMESTTMNFGMPVAIFMFVLSIVSVREDMRLGIQNGAGRGTTFAANTACMLITAVVLNIVFFLLTLLWNQLGTGVYIVDVFGALYYGEPFLERTGELAVSSTALLALSVFLAALGSFTSLMYWRLNKLGKWIVSIGMGAAVILFIDVIIRYKVVADLLGRLMGWVFLTPWNLVLSFVILAAAFYVFSALLVRRNSITAATA